MRIRLRYVNAFGNAHRKDRRVRYYFRRRGAKAIPLPGLPGSEEFMAAYQVALAGIQTPEIGSSGTLPGTVNALVVAYYKSDDWQRLAEATHRSRRYVIEGFRVRHGDKRVAMLRQDHIVKMLAEIPKAPARRNWLKAIRGLLQFSIPTMRRDDPTAGLTVKLPKTRGHHTWTDAEIEQYRALAARHATAACDGIRARDRLSPL
jgi:hypothetical protein